MTKFEFFMAFYGLLLGLSVAELLTGFGNLLRQRDRPKWGILTPLAGLVVFVMVVTAFIDAWVSLQTVEISVRGLAAPITIAMSYFFAALMVVPRDTSEWPDLDAYFVARRKLVFAPLFAPIVVTVIFLEMPKWDETGWPGTTYWVVNATLLAALAIPLITALHRLNIGAMIIVLTIMVEIYFAGVTINNQVDWLLGNPPQHAPAPVAASGS